MDRRSHLPCCKPNFRLLDATHDVQQSTSMSLMSRWISHPSSFNNVWYDTGHREPHLPLDYFDCHKTHPWNTSPPQSNTKIEHFQPKLKSIHISVPFRNWSILKCYTCQSQTSARNMRNNDKTIKNLRISAVSKSRLQGRLLSHCADVCCMPSTKTEILAYALQDSIARVYGVMSQVYS